jgi:inorganic pyrophosphatase
MRRIAITCISTWRPASTGRSANDEKAIERLPNYVKLRHFDDDGNLNMVVETPRGSAVKLKYEPKTKVFTVSRSLVLGLTYPFDWGFIPGTKAEDGDPLDALAVHDSSTYPGVVLPCRALGVVDVSQKGEKGREENPRLIVMPSWHERMGEFEKATGLPKRLREEIEQFFVSATFFTGKDPIIEGWRGPKAALGVVKQTMQGKQSGP